MNIDKAIQLALNIAMLESIAENAAHLANVSRLREMQAQNQREFEVLVLEHQWQLPEGGEQ